MSLKSWSYSRLNVFETCKYRAKLAFVDRIKEPDRPLPPGKTEHANDRGTRIHQAAEKYIQGGVELIPELKTFEPEFNKARELFVQKKASMEGDWGFTREWEPTAWMSNNVWLRIKCDLVAFISKKEAVVVDYKSGRRFGNEVKHTEQVRLYAIGTFIRNPDLEKVTSELWYTDLNELSSVTFTRKQAYNFIEGFNTRGDLMTSCLDFTPNPSVHACQYCPFKAREKGGTGHCDKGV